jgi:S-adenosylmethionine:tRNA ribosyltransferase-isomerase
MTATSKFHYDLPDAAIAQQPIEPRHAARLLDSRTMTDHTVLDLPDLLEPGDIVVVNRTRVRRARLRGRRTTGGAVELLLLGSADAGRWEALARPARRLRPGVEIEVGGETVRVVGGPDRGRVTIEAAADLEALAATVGEVPLPPYFTGELDDPERYQTVFADRIGSAAAPTAGLHFTDTVLGLLENRGISVARVELEVGLDTFRPITADSLDAHEMHSERVSVDADAVELIGAARSDGGRVIAVGTTVVRTLESAARSGVLRPIDEPTSLFITPGYRFRAVDLILTNFHVPGSTLVVLMAAVLGERWREVYETALERRYRFLSFGDAMLAEVPR